MGGCSRVCHLKKRRSALPPPPKGGGPRTLFLWISATHRQNWQHAWRIDIMSITELPPPVTTPLFERMTAAKKAEVVRELSDLLGARYVLYTPYDLMLYEYDASIDRSTPDVGVLPATTEDVVAIVKIAARHHVPGWPRGAGTGLSGGALPIYGGLCVLFSPHNPSLRIFCYNLPASFTPHHGE